MFYSHNIQKTYQEVTKVPVPQTKDFPSLPTTQPMVWSQVVAQKINSQEINSMSQEHQNQIVNIAAQAVESQMKKMLPEIISTIMAALSQKNSQETTKTLILYLTIQVFNYLMQ